jgi:hypothetical protein
MISAFFQGPDPEDVIANGAVLLAFTDDSGRRQLCPVKLMPRVFEERGCVRSDNERVGS